MIRRGGGPSSEVASVQGPKLYSRIWALGPTDSASGLLGSCDCDWVWS